MKGINIHVYPSTMRNASRIDRMSRSLQATGAFSDTHLVGIGGPGLAESEDLGDGRHIQRFASRTSLPVPLGKLLRAAVWQLLVYRAYRRRGVAVVHAHSVWMLPLCWAIARSTRASLVYNPHELETETPTMKGPKRTAARVIEQTLIRRCALVSVVNQSIAAWYESNRAIPRPHSIRNIPLVNRAPASLRAQLDIPADVLLFIHTGHLTGGRHIEQILQTFREQNCAHVVFLGDGPLGDFVLSAADESPVIHWLPPVAPDLVVSYVSEADVALCLIELDRLSYRLSSPNKLFEGLAAGVPVLCTDLNEARVLLGDMAERWIVLDPTRGLAEAIGGIDAEAVRNFKDAWGGLGTWDEEVATYVGACVELLPEPADYQSLWIVNHYAALPGDGAGARHYFLGRGLLAHGWHVSIIAGSNKHYSGTQRLRRRQLESTEVIDGVTFRWLRTWAYRGNGIRRVASMVGFAVMVVAPGTTRGLQRPDAVIGSSVHPLAAWAGLVLARRHKVPFYFEIRDLWPETLIQMGCLTSAGPPARMMRRLEAHLCEHSRYVITTIPFAYEYLEIYGTPKSKVAWISNGVDPNEFRLDAPPRSESESFTFTYLGAFGRANALHTLIEGFDLAFRDQGFCGVDLRLIGEGPERPTLEKMVQSRSLASAVSLEQPVAKGAVPEVASNADVLVVALRPLALYDYGISLNKLFDYMAAGRPILFAGRARGNPVQDNNGAVVTNCDARAIACAMRDIRARSSESRRRMGENNRRSVASAFSFDVLSARLAELLADPRSGNSPRPTVAYRRGPSCSAVTASWTPPPSWTDSSTVPPT